MKDRAGMTDVSGKDVTERVATAGGEIRLTREAFDAMRHGQCPKGDVPATARVAAILAVKSTPAMVPMCHVIPVESVDVHFEPDESVPSVRVTVTVRAGAKTGVEMEALCGVSAACLSIYDMLKYTGQDMVIREIRLIEKSGGRSGHYKRSD